MATFSGRLRVLLALASLLTAAGAWAQPATAPATAPAVVPASAPAAAAAPASGAAASAPARAKKPLPPRDQYSANGADTCLECHDDVTPGYSGAAIFMGKHAHRNDKRAPFGPGGLQCEACHGPGARHAQSKNPESINSLKASSSQTAQERNQPCLGCHEAGARIGWHASVHERSNLACGDCHRIHQDHDPVLAKNTQPDVCFTCHRQQRADFQKPSAHPVRFGLMGCSDCHSAHGSTTVAMLNKPSLNQTCYSCHAEKRGPMLWEHAPVTEDCALCHTAHGSVRNALLVKSPPLLCQQCHAPADHPSTAYTSRSLPGGPAGGSIFLVAGGCTNCHSQVHGSNHPAGAKLMR
ncbi:MAG TPA: DmsE family decaheme c-type cytochrome [Caldimonas sp.]|jgi:DmsE family decaheme c-type cytochrome